MFLVLRPRVWAEPGQHAPAGQADHLPDPEQLQRRDRWWCGQLIIGRAPLRYITHIVAKLSGEARGQKKTELGQCALARGSRRIQNAHQSFQEESTGHVVPQSKEK